MRPREGRRERGRLKTWLKKKDDCQVYGASATFILLVGLSGC